MSPISDTTVLSALATECGLMNHVGTQAPYAIVSIILSVLVGTVPIGFSGWPNIIGILLGFVVILVFTYFFCQPILSPTGKWDPFTALYIKFSNDPLLDQPTQDTIRAANGEDLSGLAEPNLVAEKVVDEGSVEDVPPSKEQENSDSAASEEVEGA